MPRWIHAPAKLNLALHITGQRSDGYHRIETIAVFAGVGDRIAIIASERDGFSVTGPEAGNLPDEPREENLALRARDLVRRLAAADGLDAPPVSITLEKHLPSGAGLGGGSANAAAVLRGLARHWDVPELIPALRDNAATLGADVPMCLEGRPLIASGIGDTLETVSNMPALAVVLVNPRRHVSTPAAFAALAKKDNAAIPRDCLKSLRSVEQWLDFLAASTRNDLQEPASRIAPDIVNCLEALAGTGSAFARMSGSGATCYGVYESLPAASDAATRLWQDRPDWWIAPTTTIGSAEWKDKQGEQN